MRKQHPTRHSRALAFGLVGLLLFATAGPVLSRMTCLMSGRSVVSLGDGRGCCPGPEASDSPTLKGVCCTFSVVKAADVDLRQESAPVIHLPLVPIALHAATASTRPLSRPVIAVQARPPPITALQRASQLQVYRL